MTLGQSQGEPNQENKGGSLLPEECNPLSLHSEQFDTKDSVQEEHTISDPLPVNQEAKMQQTESRIVLLQENEINCSPAVSVRNQLSVKQDNETLTDFMRVTSHSSLDMKGTHSEKGSFSSLCGEGQDVNGIGLTENGDGVEMRRSLADGGQTLCEKAR